MFRSKPYAKIHTYEVSVDVSQTGSSDLVSLLQSADLFGCAQTLFVTVVDSPPSCMLGREGVFDIY